MVHNAPHPRRRSALGTVAYRALHVAIPLALIALVVSVVGAEEIVAQLRRTEPVWIAAALVACSAQIVLSALRWRLTARRLGAEIRPGQAIAEYYLSSLVNTTVPGGVIGDAWRAVRARGAAGLERAAQAVVIERLAGQIALGAVFLIGLALSGRAGLQLAALAATAVAAGLGLTARSAWGRRALPILPALVRRFLAAVGESWFDRHAALSQIGLSLLIVMANIAAFVFAARATGTTLELFDALLVVPMVLFAMLIPLSVAGWGYREGAAAAVFPLISLSAASGVSASVIFGAVLVLAGLPGLIAVMGRARMARTETVLGEPPD